MLQSIGIDFHASGVDNVIGAIGRLKRSLRGLKGFAAGTGAGGEGVMGVAGGRRASPHSWRGAGFFMARWFGVYKTAQLASRGVTQILLSGAREGIDKAMMEVEAVAFTTKHKRELEFAANRFVSQFSDVTKEELVKAMSQVASALDVEKWGVDELWKAVKAIAHMAKLSKMQLEPAAEFVAQTYAAAKNMAEFKGLPPGAAMEKISAMMTKIVQISMGWTPAFAHAFRYALPGFEQLGMTFAQSQALVAVFKDIGFHAGQIGRGWRYFTQQAEEPFAKILLAGDPRGQMWEVAPPGLKGKKLKALKLRNERRMLAATKYVRERMMTDPTHFLEELSAAARTAWKRGITAVKLGLSARWNPMLVKMRDDLFERLNEYIKALGAPGLEREQIEKHKRGLKAPGEALPALKSSFKTLMETWALHGYAWKIVTPLRKQMDMMSTVMMWHKVLEQVPVGQRLVATADMLVKESKSLIAQFGEEGYGYIRDLLLSGVGLERNINITLIKQKILVDNLTDFWAALAEAFDYDPKTIAAGKSLLGPALKGMFTYWDFWSKIHQSYILALAGKPSQAVELMRGFAKERGLQIDLDQLLGKPEPSRVRGTKQVAEDEWGAMDPFRRKEFPVTGLPPLIITVNATGDLGAFVKFAVKAIWGDQPGSQNLTNPPESWMGP